MLKIILVKYKTIRTAELYSRPSDVIGPPLTVTQFYTQAKCTSICVLFAFDAFILTWL